MKFTVQEADKLFKPFSVTISFATAEEVELMVRMMGFDATLPSLVCRDPSYDLHFSMGDVKKIMIDLRRLLNKELGKQET